MATRQSTAPKQPSVLDVSQQELNRFFKATDPVMAKIMAKVGPHTLAPRKREFYGLARAIVAQQLSTKAADTIFARLEAACKNKVTPKVILKKTPEDLRALGISFQKASYLHDLAHHVEAGLLDFDHIEAMDDKSVVGALTAVKGIGLWTAEMYLMFDLGRPDVFSWGDLILRKSLAQAYGLELKTLKKTGSPIIEAWQPYRTFGAWYLWAYFDPNPSDAW